MAKKGQTTKDIAKNYTKGIFYKGIIISEHMDTKEKRAMEIFKTKPYACCYGGAIEIWKEK